MNWLKSLFRVWRHECYLVFTDIGVILFFFALPLGYPIIYTLIYNPEVVEEIPVVAVDHSRTAESRELIRALDATQSIALLFGPCPAGLREVAGIAGDMYLKLSELRL